jgi:hypothetical protein
VHLPDDLVVCFTLNRQSVLGAVAVATSAWNQRNLHADGAHRLRIWPVPARIENAERASRDRMQKRAMRAFQPLVTQIASEELERYWGRVGINYQPFYAYEEILAVFGDQPHTSGSVLSSMEALARYLAGTEATASTQISEAERGSVIDRYRTLEEQEASADWPVELAQSVAADEISIFVCCSSTDADSYLQGFIQDVLRETRIQTGRNPSIWTDRSSIQWGDSWPPAIENALTRADVVLALLSPSFFSSEFCLHEMTTAMGTNRRILPVIWVSTRLVGPKDNPVNQLQWYRPSTDRDLRQLARMARYRSDYLEAVSEVAARLAELVLDPDGKSELKSDPLRERIRALAARYNETRDVMAAGDSRTIVMERIAAEMRDVASQAPHFMPELVKSSDPGERLAAIMALQVGARAEYLPWLADRVDPQTEKPFVGYHAAVALRVAANRLPIEDIATIRSCVEQARARSRLRPDSDRDRTMQLALADLARRISSEPV